VRYYLAKVLEAPGGTPGRKSFYDQATVDQLMLAQRILMRDYDPKRGEVKPSLREFREWLASLSAEEVRELLDMPYRIKPKASVSMRTTMPPREAEPSLDTPSAPLSRPERRISGKEVHKVETESAAKYLARVMAPAPRSARHRPEWDTHRFGHNLEIRTRQSLTSEQRRQIQLAGELLQSVLEREKK
jgi:hypothetical protein